MLEVGSRDSFVMNSSQPVSSALEMRRNHVFGPTVGRVMHGRIRSHFPAQRDPSAPRSRQSGGTYGARTRNLYRDRVAL